MSGIFHWHGVFSFFFFATKTAWPFAAWSCLNRLVLKRHQDRSGSASAPMSMGKEMPFVFIEQRTIHYESKLGMLWIAQNGEAGFKGRCKEAFREHWLLVSIVSCIYSYMQVDGIYSDLLWVIWLLSYLCFIHLEKALSSLILCIFS